MRRKFLAAAGAFLIALSITTIGQTLWELYLWEHEGAEYSEESVMQLPLVFAGHRVQVWDDQPHTHSGLQAAFPGSIAVIIDGDTSARTTAGVRRGLDDVGRYHGWVQVWQLMDRGSLARTLWIAKRSGRGVLSRYDITRIASSGTVTSETRHGWSLGANYPLYRATQFVRDGMLAGVPLSALDLAAVPVIALIYPLGSLVLGVALVRRARAARA